MRCPRATPPPSRTTGARKSPTRTSSPTSWPAGASRPSIRRPTAPLPRPPRKPRRPSSSPPRRRRRRRRPRPSAPPASEPPSPATAAASPHRRAAPCSRAAGPSRRRRLPLQRPPQPQPPTQDFEPQDADPAEPRPAHQPVPQLVPCQQRISSNSAGFRPFPAFCGQISEAGSVGWGRIPCSGFSRELFWPSREHCRRKSPAGGCPGARTGQYEFRHRPFPHRMQVKLW